VKRTFDIILNGFLPLVIGLFIYFLPIGQFVRNHLPDGFWAYSLTSMILILWRRKFNFLWLSIIILCFFIFEFFQQIKLIQGTGDIIDVICYLIFFTIALITNNYFKLKFCIL